MLAAVSGVKPSFSHWRLLHSVLTQACPGRLVCNGEFRLTAAGQTQVERGKEGN